MDTPWNGPTPLPGVAAEPLPNDANRSVLFIGSTRDAAKGDLLVKQAIRRPALIARSRRLA